VLSKCLSHRGSDDSGRYKWAFEICFGDRDGLWTFLQLLCLPACSAYWTLMYTTSTVQHILTGSVLF